MKSLTHAQQNARVPFLVVTSGGRLTKQAATATGTSGLSCSVVPLPGCVHVCLHVCKCACICLFVWVGRIDLSAGKRIKKPERTTRSLRHNINMAMFFQSDAVSKEKSQKKKRPTVPSSLCFLNVRAYLLANISSMIVVVKRSLDDLFNESPSAKCLCETSKA